jgi:hypothetical protein
MQKAAIVILSDPASRSEEALGRVFNALAAAHDFKTRGDEVTVLFHGTGTRWVRHLAEPDHPAHGLYAQVADRIAGVSRGCADVFGAADDAGAVGVPLLTDNAVPGTSGLASLRNLVADGYSILTF